MDEIEWKGSTITDYDLSRHKHKQTYVRAEKWPLRGANTRYLWGTVL